MEHESIPLAQDEQRSRAMNAAMLVRMHAEQNIRRCDHMTMVKSSTPLPNDIVLLVASYYDPNEHVVKIESESCKLGITHIILMLECIGLIMLIVVISYYGLSG